MSKRLPLAARRARGRALDGATTELFGRLSPETLGS